MNTRTTSRALLATLATVSLLAACGGSDESADTAVPAATEAADTASSAEASDTTVVMPAPSITIAEPWARTSAMVATAGAVYLVIDNGGNQDDALIGVTVDPGVAAKAELHETVPVEDGSAMSEPAASDASAMGSDTTMMAGADSSMADSGTEMMEMRPVDKIAIVAGTSVALEPGGYHIMLLDLVKPLAVGDQIQLALKFEVSGDTIVMAEVRDTAP